MTQWVALGSEGLDNLLVILSIVAFYALAFALTRSPHWTRAAMAVGALSMFSFIVAVYIDG